MELVRYREPLQDSLLLCTETINACLWVLNADDAALKAAVALRLGILQADFCGDYRKSCQVPPTHIDADVKCLPTGFL